MTKIGISAYRHYICNWDYLLFHLIEIIPLICDTQRTSNLTRIPTLSLLSLHSLRTWLSSATGNLHFWNRLLILTHHRVCWGLMQDSGWTAWAFTNQACFILLQHLTQLWNHCSIKSKSSDGPSIGPCGTPQENMCVQLILIYWWTSKMVSMLQQKYLLCPEG